MAIALLPAALWDLIEPLLPTPRYKPKGGRPRRSDRACLTAIKILQLALTDSEIGGLGFIYVPARNCLHPVAIGDISPLHLRPRLAR
jgi:hypothetical protein